MKTPAPLKVNKLDLNQRTQLLERLKEESKASHGYYLFLVLSVLITTFGLLLDSPAVIIGGMIIAPLLYPLIGTGMAIVTNNERLLKSTIWLLVKSSGIVIAISALVTFITPLNEITKEIYIRTTPTLFDLLVALASGAAGAYAVSEKERFASLTGVAVAAALMPPLAITGFAIASGKPALLWGSLLLYAANLIAVIISSSLVFSLLGFTPGRTEEKKEAVRRNVTISLVFFILMLGILSVFFVNAIGQTQRRRVIEQTVSVFLANYKDAQLISLTEKQNAGRDIVTVLVQAPSDFYDTATSLLEADIEEQLGSPIDLQFYAIPVNKIQ